MPLHPDVGDGSQAQQPRQPQISAASAAAITLESLQRALEHARLTTIVGPGGEGKLASTTTSANLPAARSRSVRDGGLCLRANRWRMSREVPGVTRDPDRVPLSIHRALPSSEEEQVCEAPSLNRLGSHGERRPRSFIASDMDGATNGPLCGRGAPLIGVVLPLAARRRVLCAWLVSPRHRQRSRRRRARRPAA